MYFLQHPVFGGLAEVDQHIAQQDQVKLGEGGRRLQQVRRQEGHCVTNGRGDLVPAVSGAGEKFLNLSCVKPALDFSSGINTQTRPFQGLGGNVSGLDVNIPAVEFREKLLQQHHHTVGFLTGGHGRARDTQVSICLLWLNDAGQNLVGQGVKKRAIPKKQGLVGG